MSNPFVFWPFLLMICTLVLLVETVGLIRGLLITRQVCWSSSLIILPLVVSIWSLVVGFNIANRIEAFHLASGLPFVSGPHVSIGLHVTIEMVRQFNAAYQIISDSQSQIVLIVAVFILTLLLEKNFHLRYVALSTERSRFWSPTQDRIRYERN